MSKARIIAFYLPQFHPVQENDEMWGKGFTEWTNVAKAKPLYKGHYQPQLPADLGFYDLRVPEVREEQAKMAREYGVEGFCYWHYWFGNGKRILERPFNEVLNSGKPDFPFCLGWANHSWSNKTWQKSKHFTKDITFLEQTYPGDEDYILHFETILPALKDNRYIKVDGKPLFLVFDPEAIPDVGHFINLWNSLAKKNGLNGIHFVARVASMGKLSFNNTGRKDEIHERFQKFLDMGFDAINSDMQRYAETKVAGFAKKAVRGVIRKIAGNFTALKYDYDDIMENFYCDEEKRDCVYPQIIPRLDRTPRSGKDARIYDNSTPEKFEKAVKKALTLVENKSPEHQIIFLQAWNEWGEGNYMEPDLKFGRGYLEALKKALENTNK
ncbi:glycoside hydrolase family 99-like domain-containing protein [Clostridium thermarum]|uniref:glycosyltransferase WbsX family protein n=1 Tax=Clostridium thermarum TaxID=1716543 RepID=UPI0013D50A64|nr:glycoside hydrolase family 99-like domain-containing protein [Clostridium thermarum]